MSENTGNTEVTISEEALEEMAMTLYERSLSIVVVDQESYGAAGAIVKEAKTLKTRRIDWFSGMKKAASDALDAIRGKEKEAVRPLDEIIAAATGQQNHWLEQEHARKQKEQMEAQAKEQQRVREEQERLQAQAEKLQEKGKTEQAEAKIEQAVAIQAEPVFVAPAVAAPVHTTSAAGIQAASFTARETTITVTDLKAFLTELLKKNYPPTMVTIGVAPLKAWAKANDIKNFPGLFIKETLKARNR